MDDDNTVGPMTREEQANFLSAVSEYIREQIDKALAGKEFLRGLAMFVQQEIDKAKFPFQWCGTWDENSSYVKNQIVTLSGSMWICVAPKTTVRPSTDEPNFWQLCCKRGRDGKDGADASRSPTAKR
jgi:hypothetical protein